MKKSAQGRGNMRADAIKVGQGISIDFGFRVRKSKNKDRMKKLTSLDGSMVCTIVTDHYSDAIWTICTASKHPPIAWLNKVLSKFERKGERYVVLDLGGELGKHPEVRLLLQQHGYNVHPTAPDASCQNTLRECPHQIIANTIRMMLEGANLPETYWIYALYHYTDIHKYITHRGRDKTPHEIITGKRPDLSKLHTFSCCVYVRPPGKCKHELDNHVNK
eukprot:701885-Ditylum_brightwellii.AAC.1